MPGRNFPRPAHERADVALHGAIPAEPSIADVEQEIIAPFVVAVKHDGPLGVYRIPNRRAAMFNQVVGLPSTAQALSIVHKDIKRARVIVMAIDNPILIATKETSLASTSTPSALLWPAGVPYVAEHALGLYVACAGSELLTPTPDGATTTFTAGNGASVFLPTADTYLTGVDISVGTAATPQTVTVTVSGVSGGPYTYSLYESATGGSLSLRYPGNGLAASGGAPGVTITGAVGSGAGSINLYGTKSAVSTATTSLVSVSTETYAD